MEHRLPGDQRRARVLAAVHEEPAQTHEELVESTGLPSRHLVRLLWRLEEEGRVVHEGRRWYAAAPPDSGHT